jgi:predicted DNA-binding transcriptional regulator AlpA
MASKAKLKLSPSSSFKIEYWNIEDVMKETGLARKSIYNLCSLGVLPHFKQRKRLVFIPQEIRDWNTPKAKGG